ncbi:hypothetical protein [Stutzerimonas azotifigens]|uniref:Uncharacterized protein n=1 Tax=Stutzerimonas azotifigens TaxID=291995 RepID=A0ABR5Z5P5_9GAMM|nr:hypothetical protein [Stutzerimonas azotifigens]MBA1275479.1 hypothetical protein [Stutzerimonas azotifigens]
MDILVCPNRSARNGAWQVRLNTHQVSFRSEAEARAFVDLLQSRLAAPHPLPRQPLAQGA